MAIRPLLLLLVLSACSNTPAPRPPAYPPEASTFDLIAHRGGVVGDTHAENSPGAIEAAVERGYWMVELDIRESADGVLVVHHDEDFLRFYGDDRKLGELSWDQVAALRALPGDTRPQTFAEMAALCKGRLEIMLDTKPPDHSEAFFQEMEAVLTENGLLAGAYVIGTEQSRNWFHGKARVGVDRNQLRQAAEAGEDVASLYFLFEHGRDLDTETVRYAQDLGVPVVPSINIFHYGNLPDHMATAESDVRRMRELGVTQFQIDSPYDAWLPAAR